MSTGTSDKSTADFIVIGGGIAGISAAAELARYGSVIVLEMEAHPGTHASGRSVALFMESYGGAAFRALTRASREFMENSDDFAPVPLLKGNGGGLFVANALQLDVLERQARSLDELGTNYDMLSAREARQLCPVLRDPAAALLESDNKEIDVAALLQGFLRQLKRRGGSLRTGAEVIDIQRHIDGWVIVTRAGIFSCSTVVNAAGAWGDRVASLAGVRPIGLQPMRRTVITFNAPPNVDKRWPVIIDAEEKFYFKQQGGLIIASPANEDPSQACDVQAEDIDVAVCAHRIEGATTLTINSIKAKWAGLRTFVSDRGPVVGPDPIERSFVWCVGQGGYGIQSSPAMARLTATLALEMDIPQDMTKFGLHVDMVTVSRLLLP